MKRKYLLANLAILFTIVFFFITSCSKSTTGPQPGAEIKDHPLYALDSSGIGTISITEVDNGEAKVRIQINPDKLVSFRPPYQPILENSEPVSYLNTIDPVTGISETTPVLSMNKNITMSYDLLLFTRDLKLRIEDADQKIIAITKLR